MTRLLRLLAAIAFVPAAAHAGTTVDVTPEAAANGSRFGLRLVLADPARTTATEAWAAVGPGHGLEDETRVIVRFALDASRLEVGAAADRNHLWFLALMSHPALDGENVVLFLQREGGQWLLGALVRDGALPGLQPAGRAPLPHPPEEDDPEEPERQGARRPGPLWIALEWQARAEGSLRVYGEGGPQAGARRTLLFERAGIDSASQVVNHVRVGAVRADHHLPGTFGELRLDDFVVLRRPARGAQGDLE